MTENDLHTGIGVVDNQHQTFLTILNRVKQCDYKNNPYELAELIDELHLYTLYHFETEEKVLQEQGCPDFDAHREKHKLLSEKIEEYRLENMTDACLLADRMAEFLENWLFTHIIETDKMDLQCTHKE